MSGDKLRSPHVSWVFAQLVTFPIFGRGATLGWPSPSRLRRATLACRLGCCLPVADVQHRPTRQRRTGRWATSHRDVVAPKGGAKSRLPLWGRCHAFGMTERGNLPTPCTCVSGSHRRGVQPPVSPAGSGAVCQWQTSSTDRRGSGDQALNGPHWGPGPLGANRQRRHSAVREKRFAVSLAFFYALRAYKVKFKVEPFLKKRRPKKLYARFARPPARTCAILSHRRGVQPPPHGAN